MLINESLSESVGAVPAVLHCDINNFRVAVLQVIYGKRQPAPPNIFIDGHTDHIAEQAREIIAALHGDPCKLINVDIIGNVLFNVIRHIVQFS